MRHHSTSQSRRAGASAGRSRGSVLILVVSLLVMLAMMGTAYIATARIDRTNAIASTVTVKQEFPWVDDELSRVRQMIGNDLFAAIPLPPGTPVFRPVAKPLEYTHFDAPMPDPAKPTEKFDGYLADRLPSLVTAGAAAGRPYWQYVSRLSSTKHYDLQDAASLIFDAANTAGSLWKPYDPTNPEGLVPTSIVLDALHANGTPVVVPAFQRVNLANGNFVGNPFIAADADGDGVADSLLYQVPGATGKDGATIWAAVRIIDNNSAVNASVAWRNNADRSMANTADVDALGNAIGTSQNLGLFPSHIGLQQLLLPANAANELTSWNAYRMPNLPTGNYPSLNAYNDTGAVRSDMSYITRGDALFMGLTRRLNNPGRTNGASTGNKFRAPLGDQQYLGYRFGLINPTYNSNPSLLPLTAPADIEKQLNTNPNSTSPGPTSAYTLAINWVKKSQNQWVQYPANRVQYWFGYSHNLASGGLAGSDMEWTTPGASPTPNTFGVAGVPNPSVGCVRPLVTVNNPTSNAIQAHSYTGTAYAIPTIVTGMSPYPTLADASKNPTKVSINTAPFGDLWRGFWNVMCDDTATSNAAPAGSGNIFKGYGTLTNDEVWLLRSAIAAANTIDLRRGDLAAKPGPTAQTITINGKSITVFGSVPQAFIRDITAGATGNLTITLYNPGTATVNTTGYGFFDWSGAGAPTPVASTAIPASIAANGTTTVTIAAAAAATVKRLYLMVSANNTADQAPLDSVNLTGFLPGPKYYRRNSPANAAPQWSVVHAGTVGFSGAAGTTPTVGGPTFQIQYANGDFGGGNKGVAVGKFPFGGFARLGDILQVTFIGSYRVDTAGSTTDLVSVTSDAVKAEDGTVGNDAVEQVGRFCPINAANAATGLTESYKWAAKLFDYFTTIQNQDDDYLPNSPAATGAPVVNGGSGAANNHNEDTSSSAQGLININTAPVAILATLPFTSNPITNASIAQEIVNYRLANGPFRSIFELNLVKNGTNTFQNRWAGTDMATFDPKLADGDFSPIASGTDNVKGDFESRFLQLTNISNLLTVRSDSFTAYVVLQAWKMGVPLGAEPTFVGQQRAAVVIDRSQVTPGNQKPSSISIQN